MTFARPLILAFSIAVLCSQRGWAIDLIFGQATIVLDDTDDDSSHFPVPLPASQQQAELFDLDSTSLHDVLVRVDGLNLSFNFDAMSRLNLKMLGPHLGNILDGRTLRDAGDFNGMLPGFSRQWLFSK